MPVAPGRIFSLPPAIIADQAPERDCVIDELPDLDGTDAAKSATFLQESSGCFKSDSGRRGAGYQNWRRKIIIQSTSKCCGNQPGNYQHRTNSGTNSGQVENHGLKFNSAVEYLQAPQTRPLRSRNEWEEEGRVVYASLEQ